MQAYIWFEDLAPTLWFMIRFDLSPPNKIHQKNSFNEIVV